MTNPIIALLASSAICISALAQAPAPQKTDPPAKSETPPAPAKPDAQPAAPAAEVPKDAAGKDKAPPKTVEKVDPYVLGFTVKDIDGADKKLEDFKGKVILIVNTASKCGYTKQYAGLEKLYEDKKDAGLVILAFPSNDFGKQEPKSESEIKAECSATFGVTFPLFSKVAVKGPEATPLFAKLNKQAAPIGGEPGWNFTKYLVDRKGNVVARFESRVKPDDAELSKAIDKLIAEK